MIEQTMWMSKQQAEALPSFPDVAIISITEPMEGDAKLHPDYVEGHNLLRLSFHDVDDGVHGYQPFSSEQAKQVLKFVDNIPRGIEVLIIHCHAGISRSAAVAIAVAEILELKETHSHYRIYNKRVYREIILAYVEG